MNQNRLNFLAKWLLLVTAFATSGATLAMGLNEVERPVVFIMHKILKSQKTFTC